MVEAIRGLPPPFSPHDGSKEDVMEKNGVEWEDTREDGLEHDGMMDDVTEKNAVTGKPEGDELQRKDDGNILPSPDPVVADGVRGKDVKNVWKGFSMTTKGKNTITIPNYRLAETKSEKDVGSRLGRWTED